MAKDDNGLTPLHRAAYWYAGREGGKEGGSKGGREGRLLAGCQALVVTGNMGKEGGRSAMERRDEPISFPRAPVV
jgi:hypothetical protein